MFVLTHPHNGMLRPSELAGRIDSAVRELARWDAAAVAAEGESIADAWSAIVSLLDLFPSASVRYNASVSMIGYRKSELMQIAVSVAARHGDGFPQLLSDTLARRFNDQPRQWSPGLRMDLAESLRALGASTPWYEETLREARSRRSVRGNVYTRLETMADLVVRYARSSQHEGGAPPRDGDCPNGIRYRVSEGLPA